MTDAKAYIERLNVLIGKDSARFEEMNRDLATLTRQRDRLVEALEAARPFTQVDIRRGPAYPDWEAMNALVSAAFRSREGEPWTHLVK